MRERLGSPLRGRRLRGSGQDGRRILDPAVVMSKLGLLIRRLGEGQHREAAGTWHRKYGKDRSWDGE
jgi:hypothetical protein